MNVWKTNRKKEEKEITKLASSITKLIEDSNLDKKSYGLNLNKVFANLFDKFDNQYSFDGSLIEGSLKKYRHKRISSEIIKIKGLYQYLVENNNNKDNHFDIGFGDRYMYFIPTENGKKVIHFENQNVRFVVVVSSGYNDTLDIRKVYTRIEDCSDHGWYSVDNDTVSSLDEFRERIKMDDGLEFAIANLTSPYQNEQYSDCFPGVKYPSKISLENMIENGFGKESPAFKYGDNRDKNYVLSIDSLMGKVEGLDMKSKYIWEEVLYGIGSVDEDQDGVHGSKDYITNYVKQQKRNEIIDELT